MILYLDHPYQVGNDGAHQSGVSHRLCVGRTGAQAPVNADYVELLLLLLLAVQQCGA